MGEVRGRLGERRRGDEGEKSIRMIYKSNLT
jgi:hypothetical protein